MRGLDRKLLRNLWNMKGQVLAICLVLAAGMALFVMYCSTLKSLVINQRTYYDRYRFAHVFAQLKRAPRTLTGQIARIPGVSAVEARVVFDVTMDVPELAEPAVGRLISTPDKRRPILNDLYIRRGRYIDPDRRGEVMVSEAFATAHNLQPGDELVANINGRKRSLKIVGVALSPEYILQIQGGNLIPDDKRFGVFWMGETELASTFDMPEAFNNVSLRLMRGASEREVIARLDRLLEAYGGVGGYARRDQVSHHYLEEEIRGLRATALTMPAIFLGVGAFLINAVIARMIGTQRQQIGVLRAFGFSRREVGLHYLKLVFVISAVGVIGGIGTGIWLARGLTEMYTTFYRFPFNVFRVDVAATVWGSLVGVAAAVGGAITAVSRAMVIPPAEAMRPAAPATYQKAWLERFGLGSIFGPVAKMVVRHLARRPYKSALACLGIALATAILVTGSFMEDALDHLIQHEFYWTQRQHMTVAFQEPRSQRAPREVGRLPGVSHCEPFRQAAVKLRFRHRERRVALSGVPFDSQLQQLIDDRLQRVRVASGGLVLSARLAESLGVRVGDMLSVEVLEGKRPHRELPVIDLIANYSGMNAYMEIESLQRMLGEADAVSGVHLLVDSQQSAALHGTLKSTPGVAAVFDRQATLDGFENTIAENLLRMRVYNVAFACIIAFGVVYNTARISLSERNRELASMRVMGFTQAEISTILLGELAILTAAALPVGCAIGYGLAALMTAAFDTELYRIPLVVDRSTYAFSATVIIIAAVASGFVVRRRLSRLDLVAALKTHE
jgi:putative ABC transport system permease protein